MRSSVDAYLERIGLDERPSIDVAGLEILQRAHLSAVPFENLDVYARRGVRTDLDWSVEKVVERGRGGWCFEVNGAFSDLLTRLGFRVHRLLATVLIPPPSSLPSHLTLEVILDRSYLVDVGFGDSFIRPLVLDLTDRQDGGSGDYVIQSRDGIFALSQVAADGTLNPQYQFDRTPHEMKDYTEHSERLQADNELSWRKKPFATRLLSGGPDRVTLLRDTLKFRRDGTWTEEPVTDDDWETELDRWFSMEA
ncbi:MAG: arylamine N-acetyltransferase [Acidimicrobiia bacterium]|nr:MAG: arylamine N-acetyltransferase [Acidimicrobiia bacterium]